MAEEGAGGGPQPREPAFHGRRRGRKLRAGRQALVETLLPHLALALPEPPARLDPAALFPVPIQDVWLEVGFGAGEHLAAQAEANPAVGVIGAEPYINGMARLLGLVDAGRLANVRLWPQEARPLLAALPDGCLGRAFVLFSDPWPKTRHAGRRFIQPATVAELARLLRPGSELRIASDDPGLVDWSLQHIRRNPAFAWTADGPADWRSRPADWPPTRYEAKALRQGRAPAYLAFRRTRADA